MSAPAVPRLPGVPRGARGPAWLLVGFGGIGLVVLVAAMAVAVLRLAEASIQRTAIGALQDRQFTPEPVPTESDDLLDEVLPITGRRNVLVVGRDTRAGLTEQQLLELGTEDVGDSQLTDTLLVVQYSADDDRARILSFPRDLLVPGPNGGQVRINSLVNRGGPDLLVSTIEELVGIDLDHFVSVDIAGFLRLTDAVGGVEVCLPEPLVDAAAGADLPAGCQTLDGIDAAGFVRAREATDSFGSNDYGRAARQQYFIKQAVSEILSAGTLANPSRVRALLDVARRSVVTDSRLSTGEILRLATTVRAFDPTTLQAATVPGDSVVEGGEYRGERMLSAAEELFTSLQTGTPFPPELVNGATDEPTDEPTPAATDAGPTPTATTAG